MIGNKFYTWFKNYYQWVGGAFNETLLLPLVRAVDGLRAGAVRYDETRDVVEKYDGTSWSDVAVPYTGANDNVDLGEYGIDAGYVALDTTPTNTPTGQGTIYWDDMAETAAIIMNGTIQKVGEDLFFQVKNQSGSLIAKGTCVKFAGTDGNSGKLLIEPFIANGTVQSQYFMGITAETIANGANGKVYHFGKMRGVNTSAYQDGDILYASTTVAGGFQTVAPTAPNNIIVVAAVINAANNGTLMIRPTINDDNTIYNVDGTLTGARALTLGGNALDIVGSTTTRFFANGRLGIGTTTDAGFVADINGTARVQGELTVNGVNIGLGGGAVSTNTRVGLNALSANTTGTNNSALGANALRFNTTGGNNSALGVFALQSNTTGGSNSALGVSALLFNTTGGSNSAVGLSALRFNTTGGNNSAVGASALLSNTTGNNNSAFGVSALLNNTTGGSNSAVGLNAGRLTNAGANVTITDNSTFLGFDTRPNADNETNQIVIGHQGRGLGSNTTVIGNTSTTHGRWFGNLLLGTSTNSGFLLDVSGTARVQGELTVNTVNIGLGGGAISSNTRVGVNALNVNTTGIRNTAFGHESLRFNTTANNNTAFGKSSLRSTTTGSDNCSFGNETLLTNVTGIGNSAYGNESLQLSTSNYNSALGFRVLQNTTTGNQNTGIGAFALRNNTTGSNNVAIGYTSLVRNTTGSNNIAFGLDSGRYISNGSDLTISDNSIYIGRDTRASANSETNQIVIGDQAVGNGSNTTTLGNSSTTNNYIYGNFNIIDKDIIFGTTTGTKIGTATSQKIGFWNATPIVQPTTAVAAATFVANTSGITDDTATFDGYTIGQVVKALRNAGLLA